MSIRRASLLALAGLLSMAGTAVAGTSVKGNIVPNEATTHPQVGAKSKYTFKGNGSYKVGLKGVTNAMGAPAPISAGVTPDTQYWLIISIDVGEVILVEYNIPFNVTKVGEAKIAGEVGLISLVPLGSPIGVVGVEVRGPTTALAAADCTTIMNQMGLEGVYLVDPMTPNPCASGPRLGVSGIVSDD